MASIHSISVYSERVQDHNQHVIKPPTFTSKAISKYFKTRFTTLIASKEERSKFTRSEIWNPFGPLAELSARQWSFAGVSYWTWTWDAFDFFSVSLNVANIAEDLGQSVTAVSWGITLVLMLRSVGAVIFGLVGDRFGTKPPFVAALVLLIALQIGCGFVKTYEQFLGVRALFGIVMGGVYGVTLSSLYGCSKEPVKSLDPAYISSINADDVGIPRKARGIVGGIFQQGYAFGYLLVVVFNRAIVDNSSHGWRAIFWFSAGPPVIFAIWRMLLPETDDYLIKKAKLQMRRARLAGNTGNPDDIIADQSIGVQIKTFLADGKSTLKTYWLMFIYCILLMSGFNFFSHGSQDMFPTFLTVQLGFGHDRSTVTNSVANLGAIFGGLVFGHVSSLIGRRISIIIAAVIAGAMIYPWGFVRNNGINAAVFFLQAGVQGAWGVVPAHLSELAPPDYRAFVVGLSYQLGNLCSSASSTIESTLGERFPIKAPDGEDVYDYGKVMAIFLGCVTAYLIIVTLFGPENRNASFDIDRDTYVDHFDDHGIKSDEESDDEDVPSVNDKPQVTQQEQAAQKA